MGAGVFDWEETEEQGNEMAESIEQIVTFFKERGGTDLSCLTISDAFQMGVEFTKMLEDAEKAAESWRTHGGRDI